MRGCYLVDRLFMTFNLVFLRAHNVLTQQRETNPLAPSLWRLTMYKLLIHLEIMAFNYLDLVWGLSFPGNFKSEHSQAKTYGYGHSGCWCVNVDQPQTWPPAISQHQCGSVVWLHLHKPSEGERERERMAEADFPVLDLGLLAGYRPLSSELLYLLPPGEKWGPVISIWAMSYL